MSLLGACGNNTPAGVDFANPPFTVRPDFAGQFQGAGASSQQAASEAWIVGYQHYQPDVSIAYNPSGSGAGVNTFLNGASDWAFSDKPLSSQEQERSRSVCASDVALQIPVYVAGIAIAYHLPSLDSNYHIRMDATVLARIFNGRITRWNDPQLQELNTGVQLPNMPITVVRRSDKSGTTHQLLSYLAEAADAQSWGYEPSENWPNSVGQGARGTSGVISTMKQAEGTLGYADYAQTAGLGTVALRSGSTFTPVSAAATSQALEYAHLDVNSQQHRVIAHPQYAPDRLPEGYPLALVSYAITCQRFNANREQAAAFVSTWLRYITSEQGQQLASAHVGSSSLPQAWRAAIDEQIQGIQVRS